MKVKIINTKTDEITREFNLHKNQEDFIKCRSRFPLESGGFGSGKTLPLIIKAIQHLDYANNLILIGREKYTDLEKSVMKDFFDICPPNYIKRAVGDTVEMKNGSEAIFVHFDKFSVESIKSMNLGAAFIDQVEQVTEEVFDALDGRLRRKVEHREGQLPYKHQICMTSNPALFWAFKRYKQDEPSFDDEGEPLYRLFESSTLDNKDNLPKPYIESLLRHPENWKRQFVYGIWDESLLAESAYFPIEYIQEQNTLKRNQIRNFEGITIYREMDIFDEYQIGVDPSEGINDYSVIAVASKKTGEIVAFWRDRIPADSLANIIVRVARIYRNGLVIPEINGIGLATLTQLRNLGYGNIYKREVFDRETNGKKLFYGWKTTYASKPLLLDNFLTMLRENKARINDPRIISEMKTFVWTDEAKKSGLGAQEGFHDDCVMATALSLWGIKPHTLEDNEDIEKPEAPRGSVLGTLEEFQKKDKFKRYIGN